MERGSARGGGKEGRGERWTPDGERGTPGPAGAEPSPPLLASLPEAPARLFSVKKLRQLLRRGGRKGRRRSGPRRAERRSGRSCFCRGSERETRGARERRAHRLQPSPPPRPRPRPPRPPGALEADALNASRCGAAAAAAAARRDQAHDAGRTARTEPPANARSALGRAGEPARLPT